MSVILLYHHKMGDHCPPQRALPTVSPFAITAPPSPATLSLNVLLAQASQILRCAEEPIAVT